MNKWPVVCVLSLAAGSMVGWGIHGAGIGSEPGTASCPVTAAPAPNPAGEHGISSTDDQAQLRLVVRDELHSALKAELAAASLGKNANSPATVAVPATQSLPPTPQQLVQRQEALQEVDAVIGGGKWSGDERRRIHQSIAMLDPQQAREAMQKLMVAINTGALQMTTDDENP